MSDYSFVQFQGQDALSSSLALEISLLDGQFFPTPWTLSAWSGLHEQDRLLIVLKEGEGVIGFCLFDKSTIDSFAHLLKILIIPDRRNKGLARDLLDNAINQLDRGGCTRLFLEVEEDNYAAQKLYSSLGFKKIHLKKNFYGPGRSAVIMTRGQ